MRSKLLLLTAILSFSEMQAGNPFSVNSNDLFGTRVFIENKGQFNAALSSKEKVKYALEHNSENIYFTPKGLVYKLSKGVVNMNWANANSNIKIIESEKTNNYFTYGSAETISYGYKKITYLNVYNGIDIEYTIPPDKQTGIKYNVILHPGANANDIKIVYSGDVNKIEKDGEEVIIKTASESITEHAPKSFYENKVAIASEYSINNNVIGFNFPNGYQSNKTVVIDPWTSTITNLLSNNFGYDLDYDVAGNIWVYGGNPNYRVCKYTSIGILQWTFQGVVASAGWNTGTYAGNFVVDKATGKSYIGQGWNAGGTRVIRLDALGVYDNFQTPVTTPIWTSIWDMGRDCWGNIFAYGGTTWGVTSGGAINTSSATVNLVALIPSTVSCCYDGIVSHALDDSSNVFVVFSSTNTAVDNQIARINPAMNGLTFMTPTTFTTFQVYSNKSIYTGSVQSNGFNCLAANNNYVFYYDGFNVAAYNKMSGALITSTTMPGYIARKQGGIVADNCNNIYVGGNNGTVQSFAFNGTVFSPLPQISVSTATRCVADMKLMPNKDLIVCGSDFLASWPASNTTTCSITNSCICTTPPNAVNTTTPPNLSICSGNATTLTVTGNVNGTLSWFATPTSTTVIGTGWNYITSTLSVGSYTYYAEVATCTTSLSRTAITVTVNPTPTVNVSTSNTLICGPPFQQTATLTASGANSYTWSTSAGGPSITVSPSVTTTYTLIGTNSNGCSNTVVITQSVSTCAAVTSSAVETLELKIFPNPNKGEFTISLSKISKDTYAEIFNCLGQIIISKPLLDNNTKINLSEQANGIYFVKVIGEAVNFIDKVIKE